MIKYRHKVTGLFLTKKYMGYSAVYKLTEKGTLWSKPVLGTLSLTKDPLIYGYNKSFNKEEFEIVYFKLVELN